MGGISQFFDFNQSSAYRKFLSHKKHDDGFEAPRNSLEFPVEASHSIHLVHEDIPYSCQVKHSSLKVNMNSSEIPIKALIDEELASRSSNRHNTPSVIARLMGVDTLPSEAKPVPHVKEWKDDRLRSTLPRREPSEISSSHHMSLSTTPFNQTKKELLPYSFKHDSSQYADSLSSTRPQPREHPQEELLQKFKKEFEAWQASRMWENSRTLDLDSVILPVKDKKVIAQENLNKEKLSRYAGSMRYSAHILEPRNYDSATKPEIATRQRTDLQQEVCASKQRRHLLQEDMAFRNKSNSNQLVHLPVASFDKKLDRSSPTRIVILKPSSEGTYEVEESFLGSSRTTNKGNSMEDFLEEVRERLRCEIHGKVTKAKGPEISFSQRSTDPKQIARHIAKQIRQNVGGDFGTTLVRSESTRSYRSEVQFTGPDSPEFINRGTRKLLSERLKNVLKNETRVENPLVSNGRSRTSTLMKEVEVSSPKYDFSEMGKKVTYMEGKKGLTEPKARSFRREQRNALSFDVEEESPRNLVRSFSAPVSGTAFGKLLLEDQHVVTGAHIRRKHEASETVDVGKNRKDSLKLKERVSILRHNFTLKGKLFRKKTQLEPESTENEFDPFKTTMTTPSVISNFGIAQDNYTEVPPSPASVCSSPHNESCRPGHPSPDSPLDVPFIEDHPSSQVSGELVTNYPDLKSLQEQTECSGSEVITEGEPCEDEEAEVEGYPEAYIREVLVTAGLYKALAFDRAFSGLDTATKPISTWVFEKIEEVYSKNGNTDEGKSCLCGDADLSHRMLFDLINEALPAVLGPPAPRSKFMKWALYPDEMPHGRQLLNVLMRQIQLYTDSQANQSCSVDSMLSWELKTTPWPYTSHEDVEAMGREMVCVILDELIDTVVLDMCS